jgi:methylated-DNA-[protein]-cysteine S-methyltransferase
MLETASATNAPRISRSPATSTSKPARDSGSLVTCYTIVPSPIGDLLISGTADAVTCIEFADAPNAHLPDVGWRRDDAALRLATNQLGAYFAGELTAFDLPLEPRGTPFQQRVWAALRQIPYGTTTSYGRLAARLGDPRAVRAVGLANGRNPISIVIPCHRVIGADGSLTGYGGGLHRKRWLLSLESGALSLL